MRQYLTAILIYWSFIVAELHKLFKGNFAMVKVSLFKSEPMPLQWAVKYTCDQLVWIMIAVAMYYVNTLSVNRNAIKVMLYWTILDTFTYFYNYKTVGYGQMYFVLGILIVWFNVDKNKLFKAIHNEK